MKTQGKNVAGPAVERLKPERVQEELTFRRPVRSREVRERLSGLPGWKAVSRSRSIRKVRKFADPQDAAAYAAFAVQVAAGRSPALQIAVSGGQVAVTLHGRPDRGITGALLDLATELG